MKWITRYVLLVGLLPLALRHCIQVIFVSRLVYQRPQLALRVFKEYLGGVKFDLKEMSARRRYREQSTNDLALIQHHLGTSAGQ
jgi:hypothetical protein